jgi:DNA-binding protein H-NS
MAESSETVSKRKASFDLNGMTAQELTALIDAAQAKRQEKQAEAKAALMEEFRGKAIQLGLTLESLLPGPTPEPTRRTRKDAGAPVPVKYRSPEGAEWSGRGRMPKWLSALEAQGRNREEFRV